MQIHYLEIVTPDVDAVCAAYSKLYDVDFGAPIEALGNARTADLSGGGRVAVRAPMREDEKPVVRPYLLVADVEAAVAEAKALGATIAHPPFLLPGQGVFAIFIVAGIEHGLWQHEPKE